MTWPVAPLLTSHAISTVPKEAAHELMAFQPTSPTAQGSGVLYAPEVAQKRAPCALARSRCEVVFEPRTQDFAPTVRRGADFGLLWRSLGQLGAETLAAPWRYPPQKIARFCMRLQCRRFLRWPAALPQSARLRGLA